MKMEDDSVDPAQEKKRIRKTKLLVAKAGTGAARLKRVLAAASKRTSTKSSEVVDDAVQVPKPVAAAAKPKAKRTAGNAMDTD
jgi:hypothetical protein